MEDKAKLKSKKLGVLSRARRYFTADHCLQLYNVQVRPHMKYCSQAPQYLLLPFGRIQRRAARIVNDPAISIRLGPVSIRRDVSSLYVL